MTTLSFQIVNVFASGAFDGNALCVVSAPCPEQAMAPIARKVNLSETTFPVVTARRKYRMRIFTTAEELPFAGHPSLGTAWTLGDGEWEQTTSGATVSVVVDGEDVEMTQPAPTFREVDPAGVARALGLRAVDKAVVASVGGVTYLLAPSTDPLGTVAFDEAAAARLLAPHGAIALAPCARVDDTTLEVRAFFPGDSVLEDPGTGSLAGPLAVFARQHWGTGVDVTVRQGDHVGQPCRIDVHADPTDVRVGGRVQRLARGELSL
jgi:trans-2,3-dihydro-3-hydroxyanthranilate isomerase